ncbi:hypothetical protein HS048_35205 [Planomonospora sp. ID91781]|uniref:hypothetical protein n=1 Tax=Planomonospora sp. ID91781 TaxID=2738135 RepID=UPI0018C42DF5|nr:hypothetical protein [Planomonospora sp. ID91781]MBG0825924.1 hypothetical protein [Planomonospora sp. ID91781]
MRKHIVSATLSAALLAPSLLLVSAGEAAARSAVSCDGWSFTKSKKFHGRVVVLFKCNDKPLWVGRVANAKSGDYVWLRSSTWRGSNASVASGSTQMDTQWTTSQTSEYMQACAVVQGRSGKRCTKTWAHDPSDGDRTMTTIPR